MHIERQGAAVAAEHIDGHLFRRKDIVGRVPSRSGDESMTFAPLLRRQRANTRAERDMLRDIGRRRLKCCEAFALLFRHLVRQGADTGARQSHLLGQRAHRAIRLRAEVRRERGGRQQLDAFGTLVARIVMLGNLRCEDGDVVDTIALGAPACAYALPIMFVLELGRKELD
jgi:hypothetical protein